MYFPIADIDINPVVPVIAAALISFFCSMGGISGAFLLLPFQMSFLGYTNMSVSSTNHLFNIISTPIGVYRFIKEKRMLWPLTIMMAISIIPGTLIGCIIRVTILPDPNNFKIFAACLILYIALNMVYSRIKNYNHNVDHALSNHMEGKKTFCTVQINKVSHKEIIYSYANNTYRVGFVSLSIVCFLVGIAGGAYGIGGGAIIAPFLLSFYHLPVHTIAGSTLFSNFIASLSALIFYLLVSCFSAYSLQPDWLLGCLFGLGGLIGVYLGTVMQKYVPGKYISYLLIIILLITAIRYFLELLS